MGGKRYFWGKLNGYWSCGWVDETNFTRYLTDEEVSIMHIMTIRGQYLTTGEYESRDDIRQTI